MRNVTTAVVLLAGAFAAASCSASTTAAPESMISFATTTAVVNTTSNQAIQTTSVSTTAEQLPTTTASTGAVTTITCAGPVTGPSFKAQVFTRGEDCTALMQRAAGWVPTSLAKPNSPYAMDLPIQLCFFMQQNRVSTTTIQGWLDFADLLVGNFCPGDRSRLVLG